MSPVSLWNRLREVICWRYLHEGFAASLLARTSGFWNFLALTYIWISALEGAPPPDRLLCTRKSESLSLSLSFSVSGKLHHCARSPSVFPVTPIRAVGVQLKQHFLSLSQYLCYKCEAREEEKESGLWVFFSVLEQYGGNQIWFSSLVPHPGWNTMDREEARDS